MTYACILYHIYDVSHILVCLWHLLSYGGATGGHDDYAMSLHLFKERSSTRLAFGLATAETPARTMTGRAKGLVIGSLGTNQDIRVSPHIPRNQDGLANITICLGCLRVAGRISPGSSFSMHAKTALPTVDLESLELGDVVADVVDDIEPDRCWSQSKDCPKGLSDPVRHNLSVREGIVCGGGHRG
jgi:hypothetical protein